MCSIPLKSFDPAKIWTNRLACSLVQMTNVLFTASREPCVVWHIAISSNTYVQCPFLQQPCPNLHKPSDIFPIFFSRLPLLFFSSTTSLFSSPFNLLCVYVNPALLPCTINLPSIIFSAKRSSKQQSSRSLQGFQKGFKIYMAQKWIMHAVFLSFGMCNKQIETWKFLLKYLGVFSLSKPANFSLKLGLFWMEIN